MISFLQVSQIECDSTSMPWPGCLQYYMGVEGSDDDGIAFDEGDGNDPHDTMGFGLKTRLYK